MEKSQRFSVFYFPSALHPGYVCNMSLLSTRSPVPGPGPAPIDGVEGKGAMFRGYVLALEKAQLLQAVRERVSPATREMLDHPPALTSWISVAPMEEILEAVEFKFASCLEVLVHG